MLLKSITTVVIFTFMIRPSTPDDITAILAIAEAIGFQPSELGVVSQLLSDYFTIENGHSFLQDSKTKRSGSQMMKAQMG